jgi:hypothetical protein
MAKGRFVDDTTRLAIADVHREHPDWPAKMIKDEVHKRLKQDWPGLSAIQKELSKIRERLAPENPQEKAWNRDSLDKFPQIVITPEVIPTVLKVWKSRIEKGSLFTIREAKWVSRLSCVLSDIEELGKTARRYASIEMLYESIGQPFNSRGLDKSLMGIQFDYSDPFEPKPSDLPPWVDKDGEIIDFDSPDAEKKFYAKRKGWETK